MRLAALTIAALPTTLSAQSPDIQNHDIQVLFAYAPCTRIIQMIDDPALSRHSIGMMAMAFGFLMGFEVENPGIKGDQETVLSRLRMDCAADGAQPALKILRGYAAETGN